MARASTAAGEEETFLESLMDTNLYSMGAYFSDQHPDLVERFRVSTLPTILVVEQKVLRARLEDPRGCREIARFLEPWLR
jgi:hypothetical protein